MAATMDVRRDREHGTACHRVTATIDGKDYVFLFTRLECTGTGTPASLQRRGPGDWVVSL